MSKSPEPLIVPVQAGAVATALVYRAQDDPVGAALILAHGAGAGQRSPWMVGFADALSARGLDIITFNFLYTEQGRRMPDRRPLLDACYGAVIAAVREQVASARHALFIGGKSMGGRIATHVAADAASADADLGIAGLVLLGYPLHPPGRLTERRDAHLPAIVQPLLFVQGSRDAFGTPGELQPVVDALAPRARLHVVESGDHSFKIAGKDAARQSALVDRAQQTIVEWVRNISARP